MDLTGYRVAMAYLTPADAAQLLELKSDDDPQRKVRSRAVQSLQAEMAEGRFTMGFDAIGVTYQGDPPELTPDGRLLPGWVEKADLVWLLNGQHRCMALAGLEDYIEIAAPIVLVPHELQRAFALYDVTDDGIKRSLADAIESRKMASPNEVASTIRLVAALSNREDRVISLYNHHQQNSMLMAFFEREMDHELLTEAVRVSHRVREHTRLPKRLVSAIYYMTAVDGSYATKLTRTFWDDVCNPVTDNQHARMLREYGLRQAAAAKERRDNHSAVASKINRLLELWAADPTGEAPKMLRYNPGRPVAIPVLEPSADIIDLEIPSTVPTAWADTGHPSTNGSHLQPVLD